MSLFLVVEKKTNISKEENEQKKWGKCYLFLDVVRGKMNKTKRSRGRQAKKKEKMMNPNREVHTNIIIKMTSTNKKNMNIRKKMTNRGKKLLKIIYFMMLKREIMFCDVAKGNNVHRNKREGE